jgi:hypothetical protein
LIAYHNQSPGARRAGGRVGVGVSIGLLAGPHTLSSVTNTYLLTGVTFVCKVERYARPRPTRTCSGNDPSGPYTRTRHIRIMYEGLMLGRDRHRPHDLAAISPSPNPQPSRARLSASGPQRRPSWPQTGSVAPCAAPALRLRMPQSKDASATVTRPCYLLQVGSSSWSARG